MNWNNLLTIILCLTLGASFAYGAVSKMATGGLNDFKTLVAGDPDLAAFEASAEARAILRDESFTRVGYKEQLQKTFEIFKARRALTAAGIGPGDLKASVEALAVDRDNRLAERDALRARVQTAGGADTVDVPGNLYTHARHAADTAAERAAGVAAENARWEATLQRNAAGDDITQVYSKTMYDGEVAEKTLLNNRIAAYEQGLTELGALIGTELAAGRVVNPGDTNLTQKITDIRAAVAAVH